MPVSQLCYVMFCIRFMCFIKKVELNCDGRPKFLPSIGKVLKRCFPKGEWAKFAAVWTTPMSIRRFIRLLVT